MEGKLIKFGVLEFGLVYLISPACWPLFMLIFSVLGINCCRYGSLVNINLFLIITICSFVGYILSFRKHRSIYPLLISFASCVIIFYGSWFAEKKSIVLFHYFGMVGFLFAMIVNFYCIKMYNIRNQNGLL